MDGGFDQMKKYRFLMFCFFLVVSTSGLSAAAEQHGMLVRPRFHKNMLRQNIGSVKYASVALQQKSFSASPSARFYLGQSLVGALAGSGACIVGALAGGAVATSLNEYMSDYWFWTGAFIGGFNGYVLGNALAMWDFGRRHEYPGAFEGVLMGSLIGGFFGLALSEALTSPIPFLVSPPIFAAVSFHLTRD